MKKPTDPKIEKQVEALMKDPVVAIALGALSIILLEGSPDKKVNVPGLGERTNSAWRGRGSFGKAPFGPQGGHRR